MSCPKVKEMESSLATLLNPSLPSQYIQRSEREKRADLYKQDLFG